MGGTMKPSARIDWILCGTLGVAAFLLYVATLVHGAYPGGSSELIACLAGLYPSPSPAHPLWTLLIRIAAAIPIGELATRVNLISAICGAVDVALLFWIVRTMMGALIDTTARNERHAGIAPRLAGVAAALFLMFCAPFWFVATRAYSFTFDILLALVIAWLFLRYAYAGRLRGACILAAAFGLGIIEYAALALLAPLYLFGVLFVLWRTGNFAARPILIVAACLFGGYALHLLAAWAFYGSDGFVARGLETYWDALHASVKDQGGSLAASLPTIGWLVVFLMTGGPWLICLFVAKRGLNQEREWTVYLLHVVMTGIMVMVLFNLYPAPWPLFGQEKLIVFPYVFAAMVFGYLAAYWYLLLLERPDGTVLDAGGTGWRSIALIAPFVALLAVSPVRNFSHIDARAVRVINDYVDDIVARVGDRVLLVTDGTLDHSIRIAAHQKKRTQPLAVINLFARGSVSRSRYLPAIFDEPRYQNLAQIGVVPLLRAWLRDTPDSHSKIALLTKPDLLLAAGLHVVPERLVFYGAKTLDNLDLDAILDRHASYSRSMGQRLKTAERNRSVGRYATHLLRHMSLVANNLGVFLEDHGRPNEAYQAYTLAREIHEENISALLNLRTLLASGHTSPDADAISREVDRLRRREDLDLNAWTLASFYGYVRSPQAYAGMGMVWVLSGNPIMGDWGVRRAIELSPIDKSGRVKQLLASLYMAQRRYTDSEVVYHEILAEDPRNVGAILGLSKVAAREQDFVAARSLLARAVDAGLPAEQAEYDEAALDIMQGDLDAARKRLSALAEKNPGAERLWVLLAEVMIRQADDEGLQECARQIERLRDKGFISYVALGQMAMRRQRYRDAIDYFRIAYRLNPHAIEVLEVLARASYLTRQMDLVRKYARELLKIAPENATGNLMMGMLRTAAHEYLLAEDYLRKSLADRRNDIVLNELSWALVMQQRYDEAEVYAREALALHEQNSAAWDTLGFILMRTARIDEAERALRRAIGLNFNNGAAVLHLGEILVGKQELDQAEDIVNYLQKRRPQLPVQMQGELDELERRLRRARDT